MQVDFFANIYVGQKKQKSHSFGSFIEMHILTKKGNNTTTEIVRGQVMDYKLFRAINLLSGRSRLLDGFMILLSNKVRYIFIFVLIIMWFRNFSYRKICINSILSSMITMLINLIIKLFYFKPRPYMKHRVGILIPSKNDASFPSKHVLLMSAVTTSIFLRDRVLGAIMWILSILTAISRVWVGHHYPSDLIGSAIIGSLTSMIVEKATESSSLRS